jgi:hypothetical protein
VADRRACRAAAPPRPPRPPPAAHAAAAPPAAQAAAARPPAGPRRRRHPRGAAPRLTPQLAALLLCLLGTLALAARRRAAAAPPPRTEIVAACKGRHATLAAALASWLAVRGAARATLVDWDSAPPLAEALPPALRADPRLRLVRAEGQPRFVLSWAANLAASLAPRGPRSYMLKVDCDVALGPDFVEAHAGALAGGSAFVAGNWSTAGADANARHLNGLLYVAVDAFNAVGGYDERIQGYGYEDSELVERLVEAGGLAAAPLAPSTARHLPHGDAERTALTQGGGGAPLARPDYSTTLNRLLAERVAPRWSAAAAPRARFAVRWARRGRRAAVAAAAAPDAVARLAPGGAPPPDQRTLVPRAALETAQRDAAWESLLRLPGFHSPETLETLPGALAERLVDSHFRAAPRRLLVAHLQHGLANRLRALASAVALAAAAGRHLRVICPRDAHFDAPLGDLLDLSASGLDDVWETFHPGEMDMFDFDVYDYMGFLPGGGAGGRYRQINAASPRHVYVKSAYFLNASALGEGAEGAALRSLRPAPAVAALMDAAPLPRERFVVGVHVRGRDPRGELPGVDAARAYPEAAELVARRSVSGDVGRFAAEMRRQTRAHPGTLFFLTADAPDAVERLAAEFGDAEVARLPGGGGACADRSPRCLRLALADLLLLSMADCLLGSPWSTFSEVAQLYGGLGDDDALWAGTDF